MNKTKRDKFIIQTFFFCFFFLQKQKENNFGVFFHLLRHKDLTPMTETQTTSNKSKWKFVLGKFDEAGSLQMSWGSTEQKLGSPNHHSNNSLYQSVLNDQPLRIIMDKTDFRSDSKVPLILLFLWNVLNMVSSIDISQGSEAIKSCLEEKQGEFEL